MRVPSQQEFLKTPAGAQAKRDLRHMVISQIYDTSGTYDPQKGRGQIFVQRHLEYLIKHPYVSTSAYLSNLRVMTKVKR